VTLADAPSVHWLAPLARGPLDAVVELPGSKSLTNRALVLAALTPGRSVLRRPLRSRDTELMAEGLRRLGASVLDVPSRPDWAVSGPLQADGLVRVDVGNAGTVARFLPAVAPLVRARAHLDGDPRVRERPVGPLLGALRALGADLDGVEALPVTVTGHDGLRGGEVSLDAGASSQLISALLLAGHAYDRGVTVRALGAVPSAPHLAMTVEALRAAGAVVDDSTLGAWRVEPGGLTPRETDVEPDLSTAAAYLAAPLAAGGQVSVPGWPRETAQPGAALPELLRRMGARVEQTGGRLTVAAGPRLSGITADLRDAPELTLVLTALAALADSPSRFTGVAHIRLQETDRLAALATGLNALGGDVRELPDGVEVRPRPLRGGVLESYDDHRVAMAWAVLGLAVDGVQVVDVATTRKTVPDFVGSWTRMLAGSA